MSQTEPNGGDQHDGDLRDRALPENLAKAFEHPATENGFLSETRAENNEVEHPGEFSGVSGKKMIGRINLRGVKERHHNRLHREFQGHAKSNSDEDAADPGARPHIPDLPPRRAR